MKQDIIVAILIVLGISLSGCGSRSSSEKDLYLAVCYVDNKCK